LNLAAKFPTPHWAHFKGGHTSQGLEKDPLDLAGIREWVHLNSDRVEALVETASLRFTPIIMTMLTTVFGMLPIAVGMGEGSNIVQPLGIAVSGGLVISTLFTLFMVPSILSLVRIPSVEKFSGQEHDR